MSDFRIQIPYDLDKDYDLELDWNNQENTWTISARENGLGHAWDEGIELTDKYVPFLCDFFRIPNELYELPVIKKLSPGELAFIHAQAMIPVSVYAILCSVCGQHWKIYRWDFEEGKWRVYGRTCDYSWHRGHELNPDDEQALRKIRGSLTSPGVKD